MPMFVVLNPSKEITIKKPEDVIHASIKEIIDRLGNYHLLEADRITNRYRILIVETDAISKLTVDMGQHLNITINELNENSTKLHVEVTRAMGVIDNPVEVQRATRTLNSFLTYLSQSIEGTLPDQLEVQEQQIVQNRKSTNTLLIIVIVIILAVVVYKMLEIRKKNKGGSLTSGYVTSNNHQDKKVQFLSFPF